MTTPEALNALADRVEREEPSRDLDCQVQAALDPMAAERMRDPSAMFNAAGIHTEGPTWACNYYVPPYTTSLDAAVTLVPDGWIIAHLSEIGGDGLPSCTLTTGSNDEAGFCLESPASGVTALARAATAAALRARAEQARAVPSPEQKGSEQ